MTIEEQIFQRKRFLPASMIRYGFEKTGDGYRYGFDFSGGDFCAVLSVSESGAVSGTVIDAMNGEEYAQLRNERFNGAFVNSVRDAYKQRLAEIARQCCAEVPFVSDQANRIAGRIFDTYGVRPDFPWGQSPHEHSGVFRHADSGKWFALIMRIRRDAVLKNGDRTAVDAINLKIDPDCKITPVQTDGIYPAYHMNHKNWITVMLDDRLEDEAVMSLIADSFRLTDVLPRGKKRGSET